jgi:hypothetical protein
MRDIAVTSGGDYAAQESGGGNDLGQDLLKSEQPNSYSYQAGSSYQTSELAASSSENPSYRDI